MKKYTISVNDYEYCTGLFETEKEAWDNAVELFKERYGTEEDDGLFDEDTYNDDLIEDVKFDGYYNVLEIEVN